MIALPISSRKLKIPMSCPLFRYIAVIGLSLTLALAGCTSRDEKAEQAAIRFGELFRAEDYEAARAAILEAVSTRDDVAAYWLSLAQVSMRLSEYAGAYDAYLRVSELEPNNIEALQNLAEITLAAGRVDESEDFADRVLKLDRQDLRAHLTKGYIAIRRKRYAEANQVADRILKIYPLEEAPLLLKANALFDMGQQAEAIDLVEKAIPLRGPSAGKLNSLMDMYQRSGNRAGVERTLARYVDFQPENLRMRLDYAAALYQVGKRGGAESILIPMLQAGQLPERVAEVMIQVGGDSPSPEMLEQLGTGAPLEIAGAVARVALEKNQPDLTMRLMAPYIAGALTPQTASAAALFAAGQKAAGRTQEAMQVAQRVLAFDEANPRALQVRSEISMEEGDLNQALADARVLVRDHPEDIENRTLLSRVYEARRDARLAESTLRTAYNDVPGSEPLLESYVDFLRRHDRTRAAAEIAQEFTKKNPASTKGWKLLADLCAAIGDRTCAERSKAAWTRLEMAQAVPEEPA